MRFKKGLAVTMSMAMVFSALSFTPAQAAKKPKLSKTKATVKVGSTVKLTVKNAKKKAKVTWKTSKKKVAKITKKTTKGKAYAVVKGVKKGTAKITATYKVGKTKKVLSCKVKVTVKVGPAGNAATKTTPTANATTKPVASPTAKATNSATQTPNQGQGTPAPTAPEKPEPTGFEPSTQDYEYFNDYTLGFAQNKIVAYKDGKRLTLEEAGAGVYNKKEDNIFAQHIKDNAWYKDKITLTQPLQYTTNDGVAHRIDSMLTNYDFIADPTAIDNSKNDGKLYVYGTTEGIDYQGGVLKTNGYNNHSLTIVSTQDMVNWTDEGTLDNKNLTNKPDSAASNQKVKCKWGTKAWAPSGLKIDGDGDGQDEYYIFYTNGGAVGYVQGDSPSGPWKDDLGVTLFTQNTPNCSGVVWCFDPAVLVDDKGDAYVYFGGGTTDDKAHGKTARVCKIKFEKGTGKVLLDGDPQELDNYYMFEDSEINQFNGKYYYSYCTNFNVPGGNKWIGSGQIACYVSSDPMNISFDPEGENGDKYTDETGTYHHYLGTILNNPSTIYGESYNNHHHMQSFKGHDYIFYHSTVLGNTLFRDNKQYRNLHVNEISVDKDTDKLAIKPSYDGVEQIENFNPYINEDGSRKYINATTAANSAGVKSSRDDIEVNSSLNGSPMVLDSIDTGDWSCIKGVDFGSKGMKNFAAELLSDTETGRIELFVDSPLKLDNKIAMIDITEKTDGNYKFKNTVITKSVTGVHDIYFVFRGSNYKVASWLFSENEKMEEPDISDRPTATPTPVTVENSYGWNEDKTEYRLKLSEENVVEEAGASVSFDENSATATLSYKGDYPGIWFNLPDNVTDKFDSVIFTYKDSSTGGCGKAVRYKDDTQDQEIVWVDCLPDNQTTQTIQVDSSKILRKIKLFRNDATEGCKVTITSVIFKKAAKETNWTTTWGTAEEKCDITESAMPQMTLEDSTVRQIVKVTTAGAKMRLRLSNQYGGSDVTIKSMHAAKQVTADQSDIDVDTDVVVTVDGKTEFVIPKGKTIVTDAVNFKVNALENIAISTYFGTTPETNITGHRGARATTYQVAGNQVSEKAFTNPKTTTSWFFLADVSLYSEHQGKAVVCFGDSITDGYGTDAAYLGKKPDSYTRWGDYFAKRLQANEKTRNVSVINEGIGGNSILGAWPTDAGKDRFSRDLLEHDGVAYCILLFGVNDLDKLSDTSKYDKLKPEYEKMIQLCHDNNIKVYASPILPFGTSSYYSESSEKVRNMINIWLRSDESGVDGIIDFDSAVADPDNPTNVLEKYTHEDGLHPYDGYSAMADAIDLKLFE